MDNFICVISNSVLIYNFHFPFSQWFVQIPKIFAGVEGPQWVSRDPGLGLFAGARCGIVTMNGT